MSLLVIKASIQTESHSSQLIDLALNTLKGQEEVVERDLVENPIPYLTEEAFAGFRLGNEHANRHQQRELARSETLIREIESASAIVLGAPLYNFNVPAQLKSYFDYIGRAGRTFRYTENGPIGLLKNKPVLVVSSRGGFRPATGFDGQTAVIQAFLNLVGLEDQTWVYAEGMGMLEKREESLIKAKAQIKRWVHQRLSVLA